MTLSNGDLAELLCRASEERDRSDQQQRALRRAGRAALRWPVEAQELLERGESLTTLRAVGPWIARVLRGWLDSPPEIPPSPAIRRGFLTLAEANRILAREPLQARGDLQMHTLGSDGRASVREMAEAARAVGREYVAITDHTKGLKIAGGMTEEEVARQGVEIAALNDELAASGFRVLRSVEMNLSPAGEGDMDPAFLSGLDLVLGAFHSKLRVTEDQTERYLAALANPSIHVLAHPRGRVFNFRLGLTADWGRVFAFARAQRRAVEIDAYPDRQDLDVDLLRIARDEGTLVSLGSDAHAPEQTAFLAFGMAAARLAGLPEEQILNCKTAEELVTWGREGRRERAQ